MKNVFKTFGNLNRNQRSKVQFLIIALIAIIVFSMLGCSTDDDNNGDNNKKEVKIFTVSLDKVDDKTFTITLEGGTWINDSSISQVASTALESSLLADIQGIKQQFTSVYDFNFTKSSSTMLTYTLKSERSNLKGTLGFRVNSSNNSYFAGVDYISGYDPEIITYRVEVNPAKKIITF